MVTSKYAMQRTVVAALVVIFLGGIPVIAAQNKDVPPIDADFPDGFVREIKVVADRALDCSSMKSIVDTATRGCKTNDEKAIAIYNAARLLWYHHQYPGEEGGIAALKIINVYGWSLCGGQHTVLAALWRAAGWDWRYVGWEGHTTVECRYDDKWHYFDTFLKVYAFKPDTDAPSGRTIASQAEIKQNPTQQEIYSVEYDYDAALRLETVSEPILVGNDDLIAQFEYDDNGNRSKISYSKNGTSGSTVDVDYTYNLDNLLTYFSTTGGPTFTFTATDTSPPDIDGLGRLVDGEEVLTNTNGDPVTYNLDYTYDMRSQLTVAQNDNIDGDSWQADYSYYKNGNLDERTITTGTPETTYFKYDNDNDGDDDCQLMTSASGAETFTLEWDKNGNMSLTNLSAGDDTTLEYNWDGKLRSGEKGSDMLCRKAWKFMS